RRLVAGLLLGPGTLESAPLALRAVRRAEDFRFEGFTLIRPLPGRAAGRRRLFLPAEVDRDDIGAVFCRANVIRRGPFRGAGAVVLRPVVAGRIDVAIGSLELQPEIDRRIDERGDRRERDHQLGRDLVEAQPDRKAVLVDRQVPELVLQHDRHFVGKAFAQVLGDGYARRAGLEGDVEVVVAGQRAAAALDRAEHAPDYRAQRLLHDLVVRDQAVGRLFAHARVGGGRSRSGQAGMNAARRMAAGSLLAAVARL